MRIYTVSVLDDFPNDPMRHLVIGSWENVDKAIDKCIEYIFERLRRQDDFAYAMANDENHLEVKEFFRENKRGQIKLVRGKRGALEKAIRENLENNLCYYVYISMGAIVHFDIDENDLNGE